MLCVFYNHAQRRCLPLPCPHESGVPLRQRARAKPAGDLSTQWLAWETGGPRFCGTGTAGRRSGNVDSYSSLFRGYLCSNQVATHLGERIALIAGGANKKGRLASGNIFARTMTSGSCCPDHIQSQESVTNLVRPIFFTGFCSGIENTTSL